MAGRYGSITLFCVNDCGSEVTYRRDDYLPTGSWMCEACVLEQLDRDMETDRQIQEMNAVARMAEDATVTPMDPERAERIKRAAANEIGRVNFPATWPKPVNFN